MVTIFRFSAPLRAYERYLVIADKPPQALDREGRFELIDGLDSACRVRCVLLVESHAAVDAGESRVVCQCIFHHLNLFSCFSASSLFSPGNSTNRVTHIL